MEERIKKKEEKNTGFEFSFVTYDAGNNKASPAEFYTDESTIKDRNETTKFEL